MIADLFAYSFLSNAFFAAILASIICGIIGTIIIEKKMIMLSGGIAHTSYGGVGLGYLLGFNPLIGGLIFSVSSAVGIGYLTKKEKNNSNVFIALFWSLGMALGVLFISFMDSYPPDINGYLFGDILSVSNSELVLILVLSLIIILFVFLMFNNLKSYLFDKDYYGLKGNKKNTIDYILLILVAFSVVLLIKVCGIILIIAMLAAPAATAKIFTKKFHSRIILSVILGTIYSLTGLVLSYYLDISSGASIVCTAVITYFLIYEINVRRRKALIKKKF